MSTFRFRLATLLRLREAGRDQRRSALAEALHAEALIERERERVADEIESLMSECRQTAGPGSLDLDRLLVARRYEVALRAEQRDLAGKHEAVRAEVDRRRQALVEANRSVRALELLEERQREEHRRAEMRLEIKELDEAGQRGVEQEVDR